MCYFGKDHFILMESLLLDKCLKVGVGETLTNCRYCLLFGYLGLVYVVMPDGKRPI